MMAARNDDGVVEISQATGDGDLVVQLRQEQRNYSDTFQMYYFNYTMTMSFSDGGDVTLFVSMLVNVHGNALQRAFEIIFSTCLRNVNLQHFGRNNLIGSDFVQFNVEHTDFIDYVYSSRSVRYDNFDVVQLTDGLMQWLSYLAQSERKINIMNKHRRRGKPLAKELNLSIVFDQFVFKKNIARVTTDRFVMTMKGQKRVRVTQSK